MDAKVRAKFYRVDCIRNGDRTLFDCFTQLWAHPARSSYEELPGGNKVRLERFDLDQTAVSVFTSGELVRQQTENIPPVAPQGQPLRPTNSPLGHRTAFRYHDQTRTLLLESRQNGVSPYRLDSLVKVRLRPHRGFYLYPVLSENALERLRNGTPRRVQFKVASPDDLRHLEGDDPLEIENNISNLANAFGGLTIEVSVGFPQGMRDASLVPGSIQRAIQWATGRRGNVKKLEVKIAEEDSPLDVFAEQIVAVEDLDLDSTNMEANYAVRQDFLRRTFDDYFPVIRRLYGGAG